MKVNSKIGLLAAVLTMAFSVPSLSAESFLYKTTIGPQYTNLVAFSTPTMGQACYLAYNTDGAFEMGTVTSIAITNLNSGHGFTGWSQISPFNIGNTPYFALYNRSSGLLQINQLWQGCNGQTTVFNSPNLVGTDWTQVMPFYLNGEPILLTYNSSNGALEFWGITSNGTVVSPLPSSATLQPGFTSLMPFTDSNGVPCFIAYNQDSNLGSGPGSVEIEQISPQLTLNTSYTNNWGTTWNNLVPELTTQRFLGYSPVDPAPLNTSYGVGAFDIITDINSTTQNVQQDHVSKPWDTNVSLFAPFYFGLVQDGGLPLQPLPGFLAYYQSGQIQVWTF